MAWMAGLALPTITNLTDAIERAAYRAAVSAEFAGRLDPTRHEHQLRADTIGGVPTLHVTTSVTDVDSGIVMYVHGGGWCLGGASVQALMAVELSHHTHLEVVSIEYRLAPEHPHPAALEDVIEVLRVLSTAAPSRKVLAVGDSAGANLILAACLSERDHNRALPTALALISPIVDLTLTGDTATTLATADPQIEGRLPEDFVNMYAGGSDLTDPLVSPIYGDLSGLPPLLIQVGTRDFLLSDAVRLARRIRRAGGAVTLDVWEGMWHVWHEHADLDESRLAWQELGAFLSRSIWD